MSLAGSGSGHYNMVSTRDLSMATPSGLRNHMAQKTYLSGMESRFRQFSVVLPREGSAVQCVHALRTCFTWSFSFLEKSIIVQINYYEFVQTVPKKAVNIGLKRRKCVCQPEWHDHILELSWPVRRPVRDPSETLSRTFFFLCFSFD